MKKYLLIAFLSLFAGCVGNNIAFRGVINTYEAEATADGKVDIKPTQHDTSINAEKETRIDADVTK